MPTSTALRSVARCRRHRVPLRLQAFKEALGCTSLRLGEMPFGSQPTFQYRLEITQFGRWLMLAKIDCFALGLQVLAHRRAGQFGTLINFVCMCPPYLRGHEHPIPLGLQQCGAVERLQ